MLFEICGWYSIVTNILIILFNMFNEEKPTKRFWAVIFQIPVLIFIYMAMFE